MTDLRAEAISYGLRFINEAQPNQPVTRTRRLLLNLKPNNHKLTQVNLLFSSQARPFIADITKLPDTSLAVRVYLPLDEFPLYYDVLINEKPIRLQIQFDGQLIVNQSIPVKFAMLFTDEPVGEGPTDESA